MWYTKQLTAKKICQCSKITSKKGSLFKEGYHNSYALKSDIYINMEIKLRELANENNQ